jgi:hypothetical protein
MISINQYTKILSRFFNLHNQINTVLVGNEYDFNANSDVVYPVVNIEYVIQNIQPDTIIHQFEITIADLFDPNLPKSELFIYSTTATIADDCVTYFGNLDDIDFEINENVSVQKFSNGNVDLTAGCVFVLTFSQFRDANDCILPLNLVNEMFDESFEDEFGSPLK